MMSRADSISTSHAPAHDIIPDFSAWDLTMNGCSLDNASVSESAANLGTYETTIDPSLLTAHDGYNEFAGETYYNTDVFGVETTRYTAQIELATTYPVFYEIPRNDQVESLERTIPIQEIETYKGLECDRCRNTGYNQKTLKLHQRKSCRGRSSSS